jgi:hypothetical protein
MTNAYVIEIGEEAIGLVVREVEPNFRGRNYRFYASVKAFQSLEGKMFPNPESARRSAIIVSEQRSQSSHILSPNSLNRSNQSKSLHFTQVAPIDLPAAC